MLSSLLSDAQLVKKTAEGNVSAFEKLLDRYEKKIYRFCWHILQNQENAEDATQLTFLKFWQKPHLFNEDKQTQFSSWLYQIAKNTCTDTIRKNAPYLLGEQTDATLYLAETLLDNQDSQPIHHYEQEELSNMLQLAINQLSEKHRTIVVLFHLQFESQKVISDIMQITPREVEGCLYRARKKMELFIQTHYKGKDNHKTLFSN